MELGFKTGEFYGRRAALGRLMLMGGAGLLGSGVGRDSRGMVIDGYDAVLANRFLKWPEDLRTNSECVLAAYLHPAIGWDGRGKGYAMISDRHFLSGHAGAPGGLSFSFDGNSVVHCKADPTQTKGVSAAAGEFEKINVGTLVEPIDFAGMGIEPLPVVVTRTAARVEGMTICVFGPKGMMGFEEVGLLRPGKGDGNVMVLVRKSAANRPGAARLANGDSNSNAVMMVGNTVAVVGSAAGIGPAGYKTIRDVKHNYYNWLGARMKSLKALDAGIRFIEV